MRSRIATLRTGSWLAAFVLAMGAASLNNLSNAFGWGPAQRSDVLHVRAAIAPSRVQRGDQAQLQMHLDLAAEHHAYVDRFKIKAMNADFFAINTYTISPQVDFYDTVSKSQKKGIAGKALLEAVIELSPQAPLGKVTAELALTYQACTTQYCLLPQTVNVPVSFEVLREPAVPQMRSLDPETDFDKALNRGHTVAFFFVFVMGILTSLTPCIYPMIPITLAVIGSRSQGVSRKRAFMLSVFYVLGIAITYALVGWMVARTGRLFGSLMSSPYVVGAIAAVFFAMATSMYGLFEVQIPGWLRNLLGSKKTEVGYEGAFISGLISGIVASPCVGPVLVAILAYIARTQNGLMGFSLLFTFALGMGLLLIAVGTFSHLLNHLPRSGSWMDGIKFVFATIMVAGGIYYAASVSPVWLTYALTGLACVLVASTHGAFDHNSKLNTLTRVRKGLMYTVLVVGLALLVAAVDHFLPVRPRGGAVPQASLPKPSTGLVWDAYTPEKVTQAQSAGKPVIIDFGASWCAACTELEEKTYTDARVKELGRKFVLLKVDATETTAEITAATQRYGVLGLPTVLFVTAKGEIQRKLALQGFEDGEAFAKRMSRALGENPKADGG